ncbi:hypothetical protein E2C01_058821 [Portunus trituberculatus]|uniref:Uncharacterized protein n=1 Tax=Portunus trituberculatus TaxID=210409 RepID=A0A5B7GWK0_PORTR|nr:hypothetical protein [Portunus trituberculatus]
MKQPTYLMVLRISWKRTMRTVVSDILLEVPRCCSMRYYKPPFSYDTSVLWNAFTAAVGVTRQVKYAAHTWLQTKVLNCLTVTVPRVKYYAYQ